MSTYILFRVMIAIHFLLTLTPLSHFTFLIKNRKIMFNFTILNEIGFLKHNIKTSKGNMHEVCNKLIIFYLLFTWSQFSPLVWLRKKLLGQKILGPTGPNYSNILCHSKKCMWNARDQSAQRERERESASLYGKIFKGFCKRIHELSTLLLILLDHLSGFFFGFVILCFCFYFYLTL